MGFNTINRPNLKNAIGYKLVRKIEYNFCALGFQVSAFGGGLWKKACL
ncbi:hypothetical protein [Flectobacillus sp. BAB-3569]|nr:hypothetical protein [Flectobacillus sp. BAB-3569]